MGSGKDIEKLKSLIREKNKLQAKRQVKYEELLAKCKKTFGDDYKIDEDTRGRIMRERKKLEDKKKKLLKKIEEIERRVDETKNS